MPPKARTVYHDSTGRQVSREMYERELASIWQAFGVDPERLPQTAYPEADTRANTVALVLSVVAFVGSLAGLVVAVVTR